MTFEAQACAYVPGFLELSQYLDMKMSIAGRTKTTRAAYRCTLAQIALHFGCVPTEIPIDDIDNYLYGIKQRNPTPSDSFFKHTVYSLRFLYRSKGLRDQYIRMPSIKHQPKIPLVLSKEEVRRMIEAAPNNRHRILILLMYGCGLRISEVHKLRKSDVDFDRKTILVSNSKGGKSRYVPISGILVQPLKQHLKSSPGAKFVFPGYNTSRKLDFGAGYSKESMNAVIRRLARKADIGKRVTPHTLRHSFATHLLEDGLDIVSIKELLGHSSINTTMIYLHVAQNNRGTIYSPLDTLFGLREPAFKFGICPYYVNSIRSEQAAVPTLETALLERSKG